MTIQEHALFVDKTLKSTAERLVCLSELMESLCGRYVDFDERLRIVEDKLHYILKNKPEEYYE